MMFFSLDMDSKNIRELIDKGRICAAIDKDRIVIYDKRDRIIPCYLDEIDQILFEEEYQKHVLLAYCLTLYALNWKEIDIRDSLKSLSQNFLVNR